MEALKRSPKGLEYKIHNVNKIPRPNLPHYTYYYQIRHQINECPFIENNVRQRFAKHFQNLNLELARVKDHGDFQLDDFYHEKVKIQDRLKEQICRNDKVEMKAQTVAYVVPISVALAPNLLHHNNVGVTMQELFISEWKK